MKILLRDSIRCKMCGHCSRLLPTYISKYDGKLPISENSLKEDEINYAIRSVIDACPEKAIELKAYVKI